MKLSTNIYLNFQIWITLCIPDKWVDIWIISWRHWAKGKWMAVQWVSGKSRVSMHVFLTSQPVLSSVKPQLFQSVSLLCLYFPSILFLKTLSFHCHGLGWLTDSFVSEILGLCFACDKEELGWCVCYGHREINEEPQISSGAVLSNRKSKQFLPIPSPKRCSWASWRWILYRMEGNLHQQKTQQWSNWAVSEA